MSRYLMQRSMARQLRGKSVDSIERENASVIIKFTDGTAVEIGHTHSATVGHLAVFFHRPEKNGDKEILRKQP